MLTLIIASLIAYLLGSISSAIIVCKLMGLPDPRSQGSRNPGATNVLRIGGKKAAAITLLGDMLKGIIPVLLATWYGLSSLGLALVALFAFIGHLYPVFFHFEGGKGVATALGCLIALNGPTALCWMGTWAIIASLFRYSSLASLVASLLAPLYIWHFTQDIILTATMTCISFLLMYRHRVNIVNLIAGKENKIGKKAKAH